MPVVPTREYRSIDIGNFRACGDDEEKRYIVEGYATTFDDPYDFGYEGKEVISSHALDEADMSDVIFQFDHQGQVMARVRNNSLAVIPDERGLYIRADLSGSELGRNLYESIQNGLVDRMSWGFIVPNDGWEYDSATRTSTVTKVSKVFDVSAVSIPANQGTEIHSRSYFNGVIEQEQQELLQREIDKRKRMALVLQVETVMKGMM